jgi:hypothetical protein
MLKNLFYKITGGRPMTYLEQRFYDPIGNCQVNLYIDKFNRQWLATNRWAWFRVERM